VERIRGFIGNKILRCCDQRLRLRPAGQSPRITRQKRAQNR
jgi:hypothetical protein